MKCEDKRYSIGSVRCCPLAFIIPFVLHIKLLKDSVPWWIVLKDVVIILFGIIMTVMGVVTVITDLS